MPKYKITDNQTGKTVIVSGDSPPTEQDAEGIFQQAGLRNTQPEQKSILQNVLGAAQGVGNFIAPKVTAAVNAGVNTAGMTKDYIDYNMAKTPEQKMAEAKSYTQRQQAANEGLKQFGFDSNKQAGNQFDLLKYLKGTTAGGGELATLATPVKGNLGARLIANAVPGMTSALGEDKGIADIAKSGLASSLFGTGSEYAAKIAGKAINKAGETLAKKGEDLGMKRFGLTKLDKYNFQNKFDKSASDFIKEKGLIGEDIVGAQAVHDKLQSSFDDIAKKSGLELQTNDLVKGLTDKATEMAKDPSPAVRNKAAIVKQYADNLLEHLNNSDKVGIGKVTELRRSVDELANFKNSGADADAYRTIRDVLQKKVQETADNAGMKGVGGKNLTELGKGLNELKTFLGMAGKRDPALSSTKPLGLIKSVLMGAGAVGGMPFGPLGPILGLGAGYTADSILNSPKFMQNATKASIKAGEAMQNSTKNKLLNEILLKASQMGGIKTADLAR